MQCKPVRFNFIGEHFRVHFIWHIACMVLTFSEGMAAEMGPVCMLYALDEPKTVVRK